MNLNIPWMVLNSGGGGRWYLTPLSTIIQLYHGGQFYWWRKLEYQQKFTVLNKMCDL